MVPFIQFCLFELIFINFYLFYIYFTRNYISEFYMKSLIIFLLSEVFYLML
jgi:hypothetical protein